MKPYERLVQLASTVQGKHRLAAVVYDERFIPISFGVNSYVKTHPSQAMLASETSNPRRIFLHAEIQALVRADGARRKRGILVIRTRRDGRMGLAMPCDLCMLAIHRSGLKEVMYSNEYGDIVKVRI
jgi:tRNA(Arg) A34 adenosine deaminase TadA